jgi:hypothetical protein
MDIKSHRQLLMNHCNQKLMVHVFFHKFNHCEVFLVGLTWEELDMHSILPRFPLAGLTWEELNVH